MPGPFDELEKEAEFLETQSREEFNQKNFLKSISLLEEAKDIYSKLGFNGKIGMINKRISQLKNLVKFKKQDTIEKNKVEIDFQQHFSKEVVEKEPSFDQTLKEGKFVPPEINNIFEKIKLLYEKAEKEEKLKNYSRVIGRYEYLLELYKSIPEEIGNFSKEINEIEKKISVIREKV
ncbi:MAG: hypothetical protein ACFFDF_16910 [Candidatus Odinarchaeota archaeon]